MGQTFRYLDSGEGPLVLLYHGFPDVPDSWDSIRARLNAEGYRTVVPYLRGYHPATFSDRKFRISDLADDFALLLDALGEQAGAVVGHDWGTSVAYGAGTKYPDRVTKLVAIGIPHPLDHQAEADRGGGRSALPVLQAPVGSTDRRRVRSQARRPAVPALVAQLERP